MLTQKRLKELLDYDRTTGVFTWTERTSNRVCVGDIAGSISNTTGYIYIRVYGKLYAAHRLAWLYVYGYFPENDIDHINRNKVFNRISNLREASRQCNLRNSKTRSTNTSGVVGVCWEVDRKKWVSTVCVDGKSKNVRFENFIDAVAHRWSSEVRHGFTGCNTISTSYQYLKKRGLA